jgi:glycosyltransferase involved in cell wall biosynthesis
VARAEVARHGLAEAVLFNDTWVAYADRGGWLQAADAVVSAHREHLETRFAFRTRLLDCFWAAVPAVVTGGDELAGRIAAEDLGAVAEPGDVDGLAAAIERVLERGRDSYEPRLRAAARDYEWPRVIAPLRAFLAGATATAPAARRRPAPLTGPASRPLRRLGQRFTRVARTARRRRARASRR